jgi:hypothetical protein
LGKSSREHLDVSHSNPRDVSLSPKFVLASWRLGDLSH